MDSRLCHLWLTNVFIKTIREHKMGTPERPVLLVWDNCSAHNVPEYPAPHVRVIFLPPNCTALLQPLDQGVIAAVKRSYRREVLQRLLADIESVISRQEAGRRKARGTAGLECAFDPHMGDVVSIVSTSWRDLPGSIIAHCWLKATILPARHQAALSRSSHDQVCDLYHSARCIFLIT